MVDMRFKIWLKRVPMLNEILMEEIGRSDDEIAAQKQKFGTQNIDIVYSFICEMCSENETAMTQVATHFQIDPYLWPNSLWKLLGTRFQFSNRHRIQEFVAAIMEIVIKPNESYKVFIDRFNKAQSDIRSIDPAQVPNEFILIEILKKSIRHERALMIILNQRVDITLKFLTEQIESLDALKVNEKDVAHDSVNYVSQPVSKKGARKNGR